MKVRFEIEKFSFSILPRKFETRTDEMRYTTDGAAPRKGSINSERGCSLTQGDIQVSPNLSGLWFGMKVLQVVYKIPNCV
jgi:hypothetical protein